MKIIKIIFLIYIAFTLLFFMLIPQIPVLARLLALGLVVFLCYRGFMYHQKKKRVGLKTGTEVRGTVGGIDFSYKFNEGLGGDNKAVVTLILLQASMGEFRFLNKANRQALQVQQGVTPEQVIMIGDPLLDRAILATSLVPNAVASLLQSESTRQAINSIISLGTQEIRYDGNKLSAVHVPLNVENLHDFSGLLPVLQPLSAISSQIPQAFQNLNPNEKKELARMQGWLKRIPLLAIIGTLVFYLIGKLTYPPLRPWDLYFNSLWLGVPLTVAYVMHLKRYLNRQGLNTGSSIQRSLVAIVFLVCFAGSLMMMLNGLLDRGQATDHETSVTSKYRVRNRRSSSPSFYLKVESWRHPGVSESLEVKESLYDSISRSARIIVRTKPGFFHFEWVVTPTPIHSND